MSPVTHPSTRSRSTSPFRSSAKTAVVLLAALTLTGMGGACGQLPVERDGELAGQGGRSARGVEHELTHGEELYAAHCALCHGHGGAGNGAAAPLLFPPARDFATGQFRLVSGENALPTDADLARVLRRGIPGSAMPSFGWMPEEDVAAVIAHVRGLAERGLAERFATRLYPEWEPLDPRAARELARERLAPGPTFVLPAPAEPDAESPARGRELYLRNCAVCHGESGQGRPGEPRWNADGNLNWARDFTQGVLKGGGSHAALAHRILLGMPGTAMRPTVLADPADLDDLVRHVQSLIPPGSEDRLVHRMGSLVAARTAHGELPADGADPRWQAADELEVVLAPLAWHIDSIQAARIAAVHDGEQIAVRVRWPDATRDDRVGVSRHGDGVSVSLTSAPEPPLIGMGSPEHPVNLWHWQAFRAEDAAGVLDLLGGVPHQRHDPLGPHPGTLDAPLYLPALGELARDVDTLHAEGFERLSPDHPLTDGVRAEPLWSRGEWSVVFTRALASRDARELELPPGTAALFSLAAWNGSAGDRGGRKSFSIWQRIELEP